MTWKTFLPTLERQLHTMPESAQKHNQLGIIYTTYFQIDTALGELNKAHILSPTNMDIQANITKACLLSRAISHTITNARLKSLCKT
jgi:cytochrome c-type biogenesis protein CcmH/NrfG